MTNEAMTSRAGFRHGLRAFFDWLGAGIDLLFPTSCAGCGRGNVIWCSACEADLIRLAAPFCQRCGTPLRHGRSCPSCASHPLPLELRSFARYRTSLMKALVLLKYRPNQRLAAVAEQVYLMVAGLPVDIKALGANTSTT